MTNRVTTGADVGGRVWTQQDCSLQLTYGGEAGQAAVLVAWGSRSRIICWMVAKERLRRCLHGRYRFLCLVIRCAPSGVQL